MTPVISQDRLELNQASKGLGLSDRSDRLDKDQTAYPETNLVNGGKP
jgi:hypothetical protein